MARPRTRRFDRPTARRRSERWAWWVGIGVLTLVTVIHPFVTGLIIVGMAPSIVAWLTAGPAQRHLAPCMAYLNLCGVLPMGLELWTALPSASTLLFLLSNPFVWLGMYGAAATGWVIYLIVPPVHETICELRIERRRRWFIHQQEKLLDEWGRQADPAHEGGIRSTDRADLS